MIGIEQLKKLPYRVNRMREIWNLYSKHLSKVPEITMIHHENTQSGWIPWFIDIYIDDKIELMNYLKQNKIGSRAVYPPLHTQLAYKKYNHLSFPQTEFFSKRGLWLPSSTALTNEQIVRICNEIESFYRSKRSRL